MRIVRLFGVGSVVCVSVGSLAMGCGSDSFSSAAEEGGGAGAAGSDASLDVGADASGQRDARVDGSDAGDGGSAEGDASTGEEAGEGGSDADAGPLADASTDADVFVPCDPTEVPASDGVFVSPALDVDGDGSEALPFKQIATALDAAAERGASVVYLDQGTYTKSVLFGAKHSGIVLRGGWKRVGSVWERDCSPNARAKTVIASPSNIGVKAGALTAPSGLRTLEVYSKSLGASLAGTAGESCFGLFVAGAGARFTLDDVAITAGTGGKGGAATATVAAAAPPCGDLVTSCGDGVAGTAGGAATAGPEGMFDASGYKPGSGSAGKAGQGGHNGSQGGVGASGTCFYEGCSGGSGACNSSSGGLYCGNLGGSSPTQEVRAGQGTCGCGGRGGAAGTGGFGGGASVAVFVAEGAQVDIVASALVAKAGGNGSDGVKGLDGEPGGPGRTGGSVRCFGSCEAVTRADKCNCEQPSTRDLAGGAAGTPGGRGGKGGDGSGGAGGPSYAVVRVGGAVVSMAQTSVKSAQGGVGAGAPSGGAGDELVVP